MHFKVDIAKWARHSPDVDYGASELRNGMGYMCCLGFCMRQLRIPAADILHCSYPSDVEGKKRQEKLEATKFLQMPYVNSGLSKRAAKINDDCYTTDEQKMEKLKKLFKEYGHTITFYDSGRKPVKPKQPKG